MSTNDINLELQIGQHLPEPGLSHSDRDARTQKMLYQRPTLTFDELPEVIWTSVIRHFITVFKTIDRSSYSPPFTCGYLSIDLLLPLLLVSRGWERRILETPDLWTTILIDDDLHDVHIKMACCLHFSKQAVLCLHFEERYTRSWSAISTSLHSHSSRIQTIQAVDYSLGLVLLDVIGEIYPLPALISIMGDGWDFEDADIKKCLKKLQLLKMLYGIWAPISLLRDKPREWEQICIQGDLVVVVSVLSSIPSIRDVSLKADGPFTNSEVRPSFVLGSLSWTSLDYCDIYSVYDLGILQSLIHTLSTFSLTGTVNLISKAIFYLPEMLQLHTLTITAIPGGRCNSTIALTTSGVHDLTVYASGLQKGQLENFNALVRMFPATTPFIRRLYVEYAEIKVTEDSLWFLRNQEFKHLENIHLVLRILYTRRDQVKSKQQPLSLPDSVLWAQIRSEDSIFAGIVSDKAESLTLFSPGNTCRMPPSTLHSWISLRSLTLPYMEESYNGFSLPYLQKLILLTETYQDCRSITGFCQQLALSPRNCPSLQHIEFGRCPEWDILLLMLERRNSMQDMGISRINHISLPAAYLPSRIRNLLIVMMQGRRSARMSNSELFQLSLAGNVDVLCDLSTEGCLLCHQALRFCREPRRHSYRSYAQAHEMRWQQYPIDSSEILLTWEKRYQEWTSIRHRRSFECERIRDTRMVGIDDHSEPVLQPEWGSDDEA